MILLSGHSLTAKEIFTPESWAPTLDERKCQGNLTVGPGGPEIPDDAWLKDDQEPGGGIIWRAKASDGDRNTGTETLQLEHVICCLQDTLIDGEYGPGDMGGGSTVSCAQAIRFALGFQSVWRLGDCEYTASLPYEFNGESVYEAIETVCGTLENPQWEYDLSTLPFTLHIRKRSSAPACEMRYGRNLQQLRIRRDRTRMYTRIYPVGKDDLRLPERYLSRNENLYGRADHTETDSTIGSAEMLRAWANARLAAHCEPLWTVTVTGLELSERTEEPLDKLVIGRVCQIPDPKQGEVTETRIVKLQWKNKIKEPESITATLSNEAEDVASIVSRMKTGSAKGGRAGAKQSKEDHAWFVDTEDHVAMVAEAVAGEGAAKDWSRVSSIVVDGQGIHQRVQLAEGKIVTAYTAIEMNEKAIILEAQRATEEEGKLSGRIQVEADNIKAEVDRAVDAETALRGRLQVEADRVSMSVGSVDTRHLLYFPQRNQFPATGNTAYRYYDVGGQAYYEWTGSAYRQIPADNYIKAGEICVAINESGETTARLDANKVYIGNQKSTTVINGKCSLSDVTADYIASKIATIALLGVQSINGQASNSYASMKSFYGSNYYVGAGGGGGSVTYNNLADGVYDLQITSSGNTYTLQKKKANGGQWQDVGTFNSAGAVSLTNPVWATPASTAPSVSSNSVTISTSGKPTESSKTVALYLSRSDSWSGGTRTVYLSHTDSSAANRVAAIDVSIPDTTVTDQIATYGNSYPTSINGGSISKSGITAGKYMTMKISTGGKSTTIRFQVTA